MRKLAAVGVTLVLATTIAGGRPDAQDAGHLRDRRRGRQRHAVRAAVRRVGADRYRQRRRGGDARRRPHHGGGEGRRPQADRSPDHHALARRSFRRDGRTSPAASRSASSSITAPTCSPAGRSTSSCRRCIRRSTPRRSTRSRSRATRSPIAGLDWRIVAAAGEAIKTPLPGAGKPNPYCAAFKPQEVDRTRERAVGRQPHHLRQIPRAASGRSDREQGIRPDVPDQSPRHGRSVGGVASRAGDLEFRSAGARDPAARGDPEQRHAQRRPARRDEDHPFGAAARRISGSCISRS